MGVLSMQELAVVLVIVQGHQGTVERYIYNSRPAVEGLGEWYACRQELRLLWVCPVLMNLRAALSL